MRFHTHQERIAHPQAGLIHTYLWFALFENEISNYLLPIMKAKDSKIDADLLKILPSLASSRRKKRA